MHDNKPMNGGELEQALIDNKLAPAPTPLIGMVKKSAKAGHVAFTRSGCDAWLDIPVEMIEVAEQVGQQTCKDHTHPLMRITLKPSGSPHEQILMALLAQGAASAVPGMTTGFPGNFIRSPMARFSNGAFGGIGGAFGGLNPSGLPLAIGCTECVAKTASDGAFGTGSQTCVYLVCTTIGDFHYCKLVTEETPCIRYAGWNQVFS